VTVAESVAGERRYLLSDGLGSIRQAVDENGQVVAYHEFDPYGVPVQGRKHAAGVLRAYTWPRHPTSE
jgi:hypothetical protein